MSVLLAALERLAPLHLPFLQFLPLASAQGEAHQRENMFTQMGDEILKTTLRTFQTFITVEIRFKESIGSSLCFFMEVLMVRVNSFLIHLDSLVPNFCSGDALLCISQLFQSTGPHCRSRHWSAPTTQPNLPPLQCWLHQQAHLPVHRAGG